MKNVWISVINYYSLCAMTGVSMAFILGGSMVRIGNAEKGGLLGGLLIGIIVMAASLSLYANIDVVKDADMPMLAIVNHISPVLSFIYALTVFALIFNTAFSLYYSIARRFGGGNRRRMRILMIGIVAAGYLCSFGGFKKLIGVMYPILGYMGMLLLVILLAGWIRERRNIVFEKSARRKMLQISLKKQDPDRKASKEEKELFHSLGEMSPADTESLKKDVREMAKDILSSTDDSKAYAEKELSVDDKELKAEISRKSEPEDPSGSGPESPAG